MTGYSLFGLFTKHQHEQTSSQGQKATSVNHIKLHTIQFCPKQIQIQSDYTQSLQSNYNTIRLSGFKKCQLKTSV